MTRNTKAGHEGQSEYVPFVMNKKSTRMKAAKADPTPRRYRHRAAGVQGQLF